MTAQIIMLPAPQSRSLTPAAITTPTLSPRHRRRMKALAAEWGVSLETAVVIMVSHYIDAEGGK